VFGVRLVRDWLVFVVDDVNTPTVNPLSVAHWMVYPEASAFAVQESVKLVLVLPDAATPVGGRYVDVSALTFDE
jgi:hypothetical protein